MNQSCIYTVPLNGEGNAPASSSEYFQFSQIECTGTSTVEIVGEIPYQISMLGGMFVGLCIFIFLAFYFKRK